MDGKDGLYLLLGLGAVVVLIVLTSGQSSGTATTVTTGGSAPAAIAQANEAANALAAQTKVALAQTGASLVQSTTAGAQSIASQGVALQASRYGYRAQTQLAQISAAANEYATAESGYIDKQNNAAELADQGLINQRDLALGQDQIQIANIEGAAEAQVAKEQRPGFLQQLGSLFSGLGSAAGGLFGGGLGGLFSGFGGASAGASYNGQSGGYSGSTGGLLGALLGLFGGTAATNPVSYGSATYPTGLGNTPSYVPGYSPALTNTQVPIPAFNWFSFPSFLNPNAYGGGQNGSAGENITA